MQQCTRIGFEAIKITKILPPVIKHEIINAEFQMAQWTKWKTNDMMGTDQLYSNDVVDDFDGILSGSRFGFGSNCFVMLNLFRRIETDGFASFSPHSLTIFIYPISIETTTNSLSDFKHNLYGYFCRLLNQSHAKCLRKSIPLENLKLKMICFWTDAFFSYFVFEIFPFWNPIFSFLVADWIELIDAIFGVKIILSGFKHWRESIHSHMNHRAMERFEWKPKELCVLVVRIAATRRVCWKNKIEIILNSIGTFDVDAQQRCRLPDHWSVMKITTIYAIRKIDRCSM